jgi:hypothetical protein
MKPARENHERLAAAADAVTAAAVDMAVAAKVASEEATKHRNHLPRTAAARPSTDYAKKSQIFSLPRKRALSATSARCLTDEQCQFQIASGR